MRNLSLTRQQAELITDVLMLTDEWPSHEIDAELREQWGMGTREDELKERGKTLEKIRLDWARRVISDPKNLKSP